MKVTFTAFLVFLCAAAALAGSSVSFSGDSYATAADAPAFDFAGSFTIELQFQSNLSHTGCLLAKFWNNSGSPNDDSYYLVIRSDDTLQARIQTNTQLADLKIRGPLHDGQWHHVAFVFDTTVHIAELYLDGVLGAADAVAGTLRDTNLPLRLGMLPSGGAFPGTPSTFFNGRLDELRLWNTARHGKQASCLRYVTLLTDTPGLVSYYRFDEGSGTAANDLIAPFENMTLISGASFSTNEPPLRSRLSGPGQCRCESISGVITSAIPPITLVGDTITVPSSDSLILASCTLTVDSTVALVLVQGKFRATGTLADSVRILAQGSAAAGGSLRVLGGGSTSLLYTRVSGFAANPLDFFVPAALDDCSIIGNLGGTLLAHNGLTARRLRAESNGACAVRSDGGTVNVSYSRFFGNGGGVQTSGGSLALDSVTFESNVSASGSGAAVSAQLLANGRADILRCVFTGNSAPQHAGGAVFVRGDLAAWSGGDSVIVKACKFTANSADSGGALAVREANLRIENSLFESNTATLMGGALAAFASSTTVCRVKADSLTFNGNHGPLGSAMLLQGSAGSAPVEAHISRVMFANNQRGNSAGAPIQARAVRQIGGLGAFLERGLFYDNDNTGGYSAAVAIESVFDTNPLELRSLTIALNHADSAAVQIVYPALLRNSIVIENSVARQIAGGGQVAYCLTTDTQYHGAGGSFYADPAFADFWARDFHVTAGSYAINRGDPSPQYNDADGTRADVGVFSSNAFPASLQSLLDVPHDNGRQLMLQWLPSAGDDNRQGITSYSIYRKVNLAILDNYELMATIPAAQLEGYGRIVPTLSDSNQTGIRYYAYFVRAQSANPLAFWDTPLDSAYSVDNLAPNAPQLLAGAQGNAALLHWAAVADTDVAYYAIFRTDTLGNPDTAQTPFWVTTDTSFVDGQGSGSFRYAVRAVDVNGNRSQPSNVVSADVNFIRTPIALTIALDGNQLRLRWPAVPGATYYRVFFRDQFDGGLTYMGTTTNTTYLVPMEAGVGFYSVVAAR